MNMRKGQAATEYLMTYGWALLAIAIVGALLYTQVFSQRSCPQPGANGFPLTAAVVPSGNEFVITSGGQLTMAVVNRMDKTVNITSVTVDGNTANINPELQLSPGATGTINVNIPGLSGTAGECYSLSTTITYKTESVSGLKSTGTLNGKYA